MTDTKFYIILDADNNTIYNKSIDCYESVKVVDDNIMLTDNNIMTELTTQIPLGNWVIEIDKFGKEISDSALMLKLNYDNITSEFKNEHELYIFDDTDIDQVILDNIDEVINFSDVTPINIQNILENCDILHTDSDYKDFFVELLNIDFEAVDAIKSCLSVDKIKNWIKNTYDCNSVKVDDDITIIVHA